MRIVVNDIAASEGGAMSVLNNFYHEVLDTGEENEWIFLLGDKYFEETSNIKIVTFPDVKSSWTKRLIFELFTGKNIINKRKPDIYLSLQNTVTLGVNCKKFVYIHQVIPFQNEKNFSFFKKSERIYAIYQKIIGGVIRYTVKKSKADIIVQSKWLKRIFDKEFPNNHTVTVPPEISYLEKLKRKDDQYDNYFFYPASDLLYKNHKLIYQAVDILVKKGFQNFKVILTITRPKDSVKNMNKYVFLGKIDRKEVWRYYTKSTLLFPSYVESYGLPLKEAKLCGSTIFASKTDFSKEILENYPNSFFFDISNAEELATLMEKKITKKIDLDLTKEYMAEDNQENSLLSTIILK